MYALFPADDAFDPLASVETGAGESGGTADVGGVSADDGGGGDDDIDNGEATLHAMRKAKDLFSVFTFHSWLLLLGLALAPLSSVNNDLGSRIRYSIFGHFIMLKILIFEI